MSDRTFGNLVRLMRLRGWDRIPGWDRKAVAVSGISEIEVYRLIRGDRSDPRFSTVQKLARFFGVSLEVMSNAPNVTDAQLRAALSHGALTAARGTLLSKAEVDRLRPLADQADAPVSPESWAAFSRLIAALAAPEVRTRQPPKRSASTRVDRQPP